MKEGGALGNLACLERGADMWGAFWGLMSVGEEGLVGESEVEVAVERRVVSMLGWVEVEREWGWGRSLGRGR